LVVTAITVLINFLMGELYGAEVVLLILGIIVFIA